MSNDKSKANYSKSKFSNLEFKIVKAVRTNRKTDLIILSKKVLGKIFYRTQTYCLQFNMMQTQAKPIML